MNTHKLLKDRCLDFFRGAGHTGPRDSQHLKQMKASEKGAANSSPALVF